MAVRQTIAHTVSCHPESALFADSKFYRRPKLSDFHEMANNLRMREERALHSKNLKYEIDKGGRRLGLERRQFNYSHYYPERRFGSDRRCIPERRVDIEAEA